MHCFDNQQGHCIGPLRVHLRLVATLLLIAVLLHAAPLPATAHPGAHQALHHFDEEIARFPHKQQLYIQRGIIYSNDGQYAAAKADFEKAAKLGDPRLVDCEFGLLRYREGELHLAGRHFDAFLDSFPEHELCLGYRARLLREMGELEAALSDLRKIFALNEQPNPGLYLAAARMLQVADADGLRLALLLIDDANSKLGITPQLQHYAIQLELKNNNMDNAIKRLQTLEYQGGGSADWQVDMGELLLKAGRNDKAQSHFRKAVAMLLKKRPTPQRQQLLLKAEAYLASQADQP